MLAPSSPVTYPAGSSPPSNNKRSQLHDSGRPAKPRVIGGFLIDDDSDEGDDADGPPAKRRMLQGPSQSSDAPKSFPGESATSERESPSSLAIPDEQSQEIPSAQVLESQQYDSPLRFDSLLDSAEPVSQSDPLAASEPADRNYKLATSEPADRSYKLATCSGRSVYVWQRKPHVPVSYESIVAARSRTRAGRATRSYYGIDIHELVDGARQETEKRGAPDSRVSVPLAVDQPLRSIEDPDNNVRRSKKSLLWTEKYRARSFMDLVGDDLTNRQVLRWLKRWDSIVFPQAAKSRPAAIRRPGATQPQPEEDKPFRKILMLAGAPGLGKTTLAHVCARQAGYEVLEINASDDRSRDVVRGRIRTTLGTESVKTVEHSKPQLGRQQKVAKPVCIIVDEVDGVVSGASGSGEGGFVKALIELVLLDQKNGSAVEDPSTGGRRKRKGDDFRQMRPLILICNDVYHTSLRPLRQSGLAEILHVGRPSIDAVVTRLKTVFEKEGIPCEKDAARKLCEAAWGMVSGIDARRGAESAAEGDLRGVMVVGEWVAGRLLSTTAAPNARLTRLWVEENVMKDLALGGAGTRGLGRGGVKDIVSRIFQQDAGFPKQNMATAGPRKASNEDPKTQLSFSEHQKRYAMLQLGEMLETSGEVDRVMTDIFSEYPSHEFNDDCYLTKPNAAYEWMYFHDTCSRRLFSSQEWELGQYISQPALACHHLFASPYKRNPTAGYDKKWGAAAEDENAAPPIPFSGPRADYAAYEAAKENREILQTIHAQLPPTLMRSFRSPEDIATDFLPYLVRLVAPGVKPVVVGGSDKGAAVASVRREAEKAMVRRAADVLADVGISLHRGKIEETDPPTSARTQWVYRMEPDLDMLATFETGSASLSTAQAPTRYAVRQVLDQELYKTLALRESAARQARFRAGRAPGTVEDSHPRFDDKENGPPKHGEEKASRPARRAKRDFFGRVVETPLEDLDVNAGRRGMTAPLGSSRRDKVWVTYNEGLNNAVKRPITLDDFLRVL